MGWVETLASLLHEGAGNLASYLAAHVVLCLLPAFFIAGGLTALVPPGSITRFLGRRAPKYISYPAAALAGSFLAVCSCTVIPLFAAIHRKGAGIGPAITFLFFAPAANILALAYTGVAIGIDLALARLTLSLAFGVGIGMIMALIFRKDDLRASTAEDASFSEKASIPRPALTFLALLVLTLLAGTLKIAPLSDSLLTTRITGSFAPAAQRFLDRIVPYDASLGEEGVSLQGAILILLLVPVAIASWKGLNRVLEGTNRWTWISLLVAGVGIVLASMRVEVTAGGLAIGLTGRTAVVSLLLLSTARIVRRNLASDEVRNWLWETWRFVRQIFPLLTVGVFAVGILRAVIRPEWVEALAGQNTLLGNLAGVAFGVFMYFPTLVEVPIAQMFLGLGMHRGPLLAYLMADPELSLQSILVVAGILGRRKAWTYVGWVALFSTLAGLLYGAWADGTGTWKIVLYLAALIVALGMTLCAVNRRLTSSPRSAAKAA